jgi:hypothetical protein
VNETTVCGYCDEPVEVGYQPPHGAVQAWLDGRPAHNECGLRSALGGIGHLTDHNRWCLTEGDPDGGYSFRESALLVSAWVEEHGIDAAVGKGP